MGHLIISNCKSLLEIQKTGHISIYAKLGKRSTKTIADIFSDLLAIRKGDLIFLWIVKHRDCCDGEVGFKYVFRVKNKPFFLEGEKQPFVIPLEKKYSEHKNWLSEAVALDLFEKKILWNAIGKKSLGRGRAITHQTPFEDKLLLNKMGRRYVRKDLKSENYSKAKSITISPNIQSNKTNNYKNLKAVKLTKLPFFNKHKTNFSFEKVLEAYIMENIEKINKFIFPHTRGVSWAGNYSPYGVQGSNIDIIILNKENKVAVLELKINSLGSKSYDLVKQQVLGYCDFVGKAFSKKKKDLIPVIISLKSKQSFSKIIKNEKVKLLYYQIENNKIEFIKH
ncbi:MAG: hypothetical protein PHW02_04355 [bacterium]|nr:hypothetical protein [bacterium]